MNDELYLNKDGVLFSTHRIEGFKKWSEIIAEKFPGYSYNYDKWIIENEQAQTLNFKDVKKLFLTDISAKTSEEYREFC